MYSSAVNLGSDCPRDGIAGRGGTLVWSVCVVRCRGGTLPIKLLEVRSVKVWESARGTVDERTEADSVAQASTETTLESALTLAEYPAEKEAATEKASASAEVG
jgi:hypothetical protein